MFLIKAFAPDPRVYKEAKSLGENGFRVTVMACDHEGIYEKEKEYGSFRVIQITPLATRNINSPTIRGFFIIINVILFSLYSFFHGLRHRYDYYHAHDLNTLHIPVLLKLITQKKIIYDSHEYYPEVLRGIFRPLGYMGEVFEGIFCRFVDQIVTTNHLIKERLSKYNKPITLVSNCVDLDWFDSVKGEEMSRDGRPVVLYQGILKERRGIRELLESRRHVKHRARFLILGDGPYAKQLRKRCEEEKDIEFMGKVDYNKVPLYIRSANIGTNLLLPGFQNDYGTPNKLYEYMAGNLALLVSDLPEMARIVEEGRCGYVVNPTNLEDIAEKLNQLLGNHELMTEMGRNARNLVERKYNWKAQAQNLILLYRGLS